MLAFGAFVLPGQASAQQGCPAPGTLFDYHDLYEGTVYRQDNGWVRVTAEEGSTRFSNYCPFVGPDGRRYSVAPDDPRLRRVAANAPLPPRPAEPQFNSPIQVGVYECDSPQMIGGMVMPSPSTGHMFGVFGPGSYRDFNGGRGAFSYSGGVLTMTSGPLRGIRYRRSGETLFYPLDQRGQTGSIRCVLNRAKSLNGRW
jgi:hypothetical protein